MSPYFAWGVYLDDNAGGVDVIGNIVARCPRAGLHLHNGRDNLIENNVFIDNGLYQAEYSGWTETQPHVEGPLPHDGQRLRDRSQTSRHGRTCGT